MEFKRNAAALALCLVLALALVGFVLADSSTSPDCFAITYDQRLYNSIWVQKDQISLANRKCRSCCKKAKYRFGYLNYDNVRACECTNNLLHKIGHTRGYQLTA